MARFPEMAEFLLPIICVSITAGARILISREEKLINKNTHKIINYVNNFIEIFCMVEPRS